MHEPRRPGITRRMPPLHRAMNLVGVTLPFAGFLVAIVLLWNTDLVGWVDVALFACLYFLTCLGVTLGFHRLLTHRSFQTHKWMEYLLAILGSMAMQGPVMSWVADHRAHHAHTDHEGDPLRGGRHARRRDRRGDLGRRGAHLHAPPRDVVDQLGLPLLRPPALRGRGPLDQRVLARPAVVRRVVAPQPPR